MGKKLQLTIALTIAALFGVIIASQCAKADGPTISVQSSIVSQTPVITAGAYAANRALGGQLSFSFATGKKQSSVLESLILIDKAKQNSSIDLFCFDQPFTPSVDHAAFNISAADAQHVVAVVSMLNTQYVDIGSSTVTEVPGIGVVFPTQRDQTLYCQMVTRGTPTFVSTSDITIKLGFLQD